MEKFNFDDFMVENNQTIKLHEFDPTVTNVYAIGDVHGCYEEMKALYNKCVEDALSKDKAWYVFFMGDLIDRGPYFKEVFQFLEDHKDYTSCILGNHELNFYLEELGVKVCRSKARKISHEESDKLSTVEYDRMMKIIGDMPICVLLYFSDETGRDYMPIMLSHSPIKNIEFSRTDNITSKNGADFCMRNTVVDHDALHEEFDGVIMVHGHQSWNFTPVEQQIKDQADYANRVINLDSGCVYGNVLTGICLNNLEEISVPAKKAYTTKS